MALAKHYTRGVSDFIAALIMIAISVAAAIIYATFTSMYFESVTPRSSNLRLSVASVEVLQSGVPKTFEVSPNNIYDSNYAYRVILVLHNAGTEPIENLRYSARSLDNRVLTVGTSRNSDVYDPIALAYTQGQQLPYSIPPNQAVAFSLLVLSKKNLLDPQNAVLVLVVKGTLPTGDTQEAQVTLFG